MKKHLGKSLTLAILLSVCGGYTMFGNVGVAEAEYITYYGTSTDNNDSSIIDVTKNNECGVTKNEDLTAYKEVEMIC